MKYCKFYLCVLLIIICNFTLINPALSQSKKDKDFPEFVFDTWGSAPSRNVYKIAGEKLVQKILYSIKDHYLSAKEITAKVGESESLVLEKLKELEQYDLVKSEGVKWISNIPLYMEEELREAEKVGLKHAEREAEILRNAIPKLKSVYSKTTVSQYFPWEDVSLIIVGALLADFCVVDRIPFRPENFTEELQPPLKKADGSKWGYTGFEKLPQRFPSRKWAFYQNVNQNNIGGTARFGYYMPSEKRKISSSDPQALSPNILLNILFAIAEEPLCFREIITQTGLKDEVLQKALDEMTGYTPPAVILKESKYYPKIPILTESDLALLLPECDKVAEEIFKSVVLENLKSRKERARELGYRWPLPEGCYARDKALQILIEEGLLSPVPPPPVDWNFCVWGWKGHIPMWGEITEKEKK